MMKKKNINIKIIILTIIVIAAIFYLVKPTTKECGSDNDCFKNAAEKCSNAKFTLDQKGEISLFEITGQEESDCEVKITLIKSERMSDLVGEGVNCTISKENLAEKGFAAISPLSEKCEGPMKEELIKRFEK